MRSFGVIDGGGVRGRLTLSVSLERRRDVIAKRAHWRRWYALHNVKRTSNGRCTRFETFTNRFAEPRYGVLIASASTKAADGRYEIFDLRLFLRGSISQRQAALQS